MNKKRQFKPGCVSIQYLSRTFVVICLTTVSSMAQAIELLPDDPPIASLISVNSPDDNGNVSVVGEPESVQGDVPVILVTMENGAFSSTQSNADGSFEVSGHFAPAGTTIMIKTDPLGISNNRILENIEQIISSMKTAKAPKIKKIISMSI